MLKGIKRIAGGCIIVWIAICLGYGYQQITSANRETKDEYSTSDVQQQDTAEFQTQESEAILGTDSSGEEEHQNFYYAYQTLDAEGKTLYRDIYIALCNQESEISVSTVDVDFLNHVFTCIMSDHPELFYVDGYQYTKHTIGNVVTKLVFKGDYIYSKEVVAQYRQQIEATVDTIFKEIDSSADDYEIVKSIYEYIILHTDYDLEAENNQNILSVLLNHRSVCQGYAKTMQFLLQKLGIECVLVTGEANNDGHAWNIVKVNGAYYHIDSTWGDASYVMNEKKQQSQVPPINYNYMLVSDEDIKTTHKMDQMILFPACTQNQDNYFVREGLFFQSYDENKLTDVFQEAYAMQKAYVTIKVGSEQVYQMFHAELFEQQKIFDYLRENSNTVSYTEDDAQRIISIGL